ncbi:MAG: hypothetical protein CVU11_15275 [Bacteroidetes bacterium HGW-Bacteroidetes-6]|jgi:two-component system LytT family response regulator|nr:MAG: hypothetical protein CVU11_15275 [Bacteroidetes bacterium HGW-Bacteroidetes-6]
MIKIVVVDDEEKARKSISFLLKDFSDVEIVGEASSASEAVTVIEKIRPDLVFLDVVMPQQSGFDLLDKLLLLGLNDFDVIFLTAHEEFAIKAFKYAAFDYLLKPIDKQELTEALIRFRNKKKTDLESRAETLNSFFSDNKIRVSLYYDGCVMLINPEEIVWLEANRAHTKIWFNDGKEQIVSQNMGQIETKLNPNYFIKVHKSRIINKKYLLRFVRSDKTLVIKCGNEEVSVRAATRFDMNQL